MKCIKKFSANDKGIVRATVAIEDNNGMTVNINVKVVAKGDGTKFVQLPSYKTTNSDGVDTWHPIVTAKKEVTDEMLKLIEAAPEYSSEEPA